MRITPVISAVAVMSVLLATHPCAAQDKGAPKVAVTTVAAPSDTSLDEKKNDKKEKSFFKYEGHLYAGWTLKNKRENNDSTLSNEFSVEKARIKLSVEPLDWLKGVVQVDLADAFSGGLLKDAYVHLSPSRYIQLRAGQFKKPFSGLRLTSSAKLRMIDRGEGNDTIVEDLRYGDRDLGFQLSGRLVKKIKLDYALGAFNGSGPDVSDTGNSKDIVARLEATPVKILGFGLNGSFKFIDDPATDRGQPSSGQGWGADASLHIKGFRFFAQGLAAIDYQLYNYLELDADHPPWILNALAVISYQHGFDTRTRFEVEPAFQFEYVDPQMKVVDDGVFVYTAGLNTYIGPFFRVMLNGEFQRTSRNTLASHYGEGEKLMVLLCLDI